MNGFSLFDVRPAATLSMMLAAVLSISSAAAGATCGLCNTEVVMTSDLASCFLEKYGELAKDNDATIVVDLSDCRSRGIVEALPTPGVSTDEPDTQFMISRTQLDCLKKKLEQPDLVLDPSATIDLAACS